MRYTAWRDREGAAIPLNRSAIPFYNPHYISDCVELTIGAAGLCRVPPTILNVAGVEVKSKIELLDMLSGVLDMDYRLEESGEEDLAWVGDTSSMLRSLGEPKVGLKQGIERMLKQRYSFRP